MDKRIDGWAGATIKAVSAKGTGEFEAILSSPRLDRDGEVIAGGAFAPLPDHINIDLDHSLKALDIVASGTPYYDGDVLKIKGTFAGTPKGQEARQLVTEGHLRSLSVAFREPVVDVKDGTPVITKAELMNATFAAIPANSDALVLSAKVGARNSASDQSALQAAHDALVNAGAVCVTKTHAPAGFKAVDVALMEGLVELIRDHPDDPAVVELIEAVAARWAAIGDESTSTDPEQEAAADEAAADAPADVTVARAQAELALAEAELALE